MIRSDLALAALATAAVPGMRPVSVAAIRSGEDNPLHQSALVEDVTGRTWVVRSPLSPAAGAELERNDDLVRQLGKHLPFKVPAAAGYADLGPDGRAAVYPYVEGQALRLRHLPVGPGLASAVGRAIAAVHNMPRELFEEFAVPVFDAAEFRDRKLSALDRAAETGHVPNGLLARWEQALDAAPLWQFGTVPTHGVLDGESFLVVFSDQDDSASGRVVGLTGWERAQVADPAEDFARLVEMANPRAVDTVFDSYSLARSQRPDGYLLSRARLASEMRLLDGLAAAVGSGDEQFVRHRADELRKLDRLTANDDSLIPRTALAPPVADARTEPVADESWDVDEGSAASAGDASASTEDASAHVGDAPTVDLTGATLTDAPADTAEDTDEADTDEEAAFEVEAPAEGAHLEPVAPAEPQVSPADVTAPIPMFRPVPPATGSEGAAGPDTTAGETAGSEVSSSATSEPDLTEPDASASEAPENDAADSQTLETEAAPDVTGGRHVAADSEVADDGEVADDAAAPDEEVGADEPTADEGTADEPTADEDTTDEAVPTEALATQEAATQEAATQEAATQEAATQEAATEEVATEADAADVPDDHGEETGQTPADEHATSDEAAEAQERADRAAEERLHTIYGMPEAADLEPREPDDR